MKYNILFVTNLPFPQGMAGTKRVRLFAEYLSEQGCATSLIVTSDSNAPNPSEGTFKEIAFQTMRPILSKEIMNLFLIPFTKFRIIRYLRKHKVPDKDNLIYLYDGLSVDNLLFVIIGRMLGYKVIVDIVEDYTLHQEDFSGLHNLKLKLNEFIQKRYVRKMDGVVVVSSYLGEKWRPQGSADYSVLIIPAVAENVLLEPRPLDTEKPVTVFLYSGSFGNKDGVDFLLKAFDRISDKYSDAELWLTGSMNHRTEELIKSLDNDRIQFKGLLPDEEYYDVIGRADILCMTRAATGYANAGFPFKLGEYLATGKPIIATDVSDIKRYLIDKSDIILAEPSDEESLFGAMEFAVNNKPLLAQIGLNGRKKALEYFHPRTNGKAVLDFIDAAFGKER